jgi:prophage regulatory protein
MPTTSTRSATKKPSKHAQPHRKATTKTAKPARRTRAYDPNSDIVRGFHLPAATGLSPTTTWRLRNAGKFPPPLRLGDNSIGWRRADLVAWLATRAVQPV